MGNVETRNLLYDIIYIYFIFIFVIAESKKCTGSLFFQVTAILLLLCLIALSIFVIVLVSSGSYRRNDLKITARNAGLILESEDDPIFSSNIAYMMLSMRPKKELDIVMSASGSDEFEDGERFRISQINNLQRFLTIIFWVCIVLVVVILMEICHWCFSKHRRVDPDDEVTKFTCVCCPCKNKTAS